MHIIEPDMVLGKSLVDDGGGTVGEIVDVGLFNHSRVKFLVVQEADKRVPIRTVDVSDVDRVSADTVTLRVKG